MQTAGFHTRRGGGEVLKAEPSELLTDWVWRMRQNGDGSQFCHLGDGGRTLPLTESYKFAGGTLGEIKSSHFHMLSLKCRQQPSGEVPLSLSGKIRGELMDGKPLVRGGLEALGWNHAG